jgi:hypothetical protein
MIWLVFTTILYLLSSFNKINTKGSYGIAESMYASLAGGYSENLEFGCEDQRV